MKKPKFSFGAGGIQGWLAQHVEKIVLAVVVGLVGMFIYSGYSKEGYTKNPADLHTKAVSAEQMVALDTSLTRITKEKRDRVEPYRERVMQSQRPTAASEYSIMPFNPSMFPPTQPRQDPEIFAPLLVETEGFLVAIHEAVEDVDDPYKDDKNSAPTKKASTAPKKADNRKQSKDGGGMPQMGPPGEGGKGKKGSGKGSGSGMPMPGGAGMSGMPGMGGLDDGGMDDGGALGGMAGMGGMGASASVSESYLQKYVRGYRPGGGGGVSGPMSGGAASSARGIGVSRYVVAVKAVIPHQKLVDEYRRVFAEAQGYEPLRDTPRYVYYSVERADVGPDPDAAPTWEPIRVRDAWKVMETWSGTTPEVADARFVDPVLTQPMPPALMVDPVKLGLHSEVPRLMAAADALNDPRDGKKKTKGEKGKSEGEDDAPSGFPSAGGGTPGMPAMPGMPGMPGMPAGGGVGMPGMSGPGKGAPMPGMGGLAGGPGKGPGMMPGMGPPGGMSPPGMGMPGMGMPGMGGMAGMGGMSFGEVAEAVKHKMIRFYDFDVVPEKQYRYRVRVWIEDPNHPQSDEMAPSPKILSVKVAERVKALDDKEKGGAKRVFYRMTDWSKPSDPVRLPTSMRFVAGQVRSGRALEIRDQKMSVPLEEPSATLLPIVWDVQRAVDVPGFADAPDDPKNPNDKEKPSAYRGTVLNFKKDATVLRPDSLELKLLEKYPFMTNAVVVDLRSSEPIRDGEKKPGERKDPLLTAGEILIVDQDGNLIVRNELDDIEDYRKYMFVDEDKPAAGGMAGGGLGMPDMGGPGAGMPGMPGMGGPGMMPPGLGGGGDGPGKGKAGGSKGKGGKIK